jgi:hypothetical protein
MIIYSQPVPLAPLDHFENDQWCLAMFILKSSLTKDKAE